jgi:hypothetical protein
MTRVNPRISTRTISSSRRLRKLRFDILEDRRLLAGVDVFVFEDLDASRFYDPAKDGALSGRAVYVDLNNDGRLNASESWAVSDRNGIASFPNLEPGIYSVRLLGSNKSVEQTFPTRPAEQGIWSNGLGIKKVLGVEASGAAWVVAGSSLTRIGDSDGLPSRSIGFGSASIVDAVFERSMDGSSFTGFVLTRNPDQSQVLWKVSTVGSGSKLALNLEVNAAKQLVSVGSKVLVVGGGDTKEIGILDTDLASTAVVMKAVGIVGLASTAVVQESRGISFVVFDEGSNELSLYKLSDGQGQLVGKRSFASKVLDWQVSDDNGSVAVSTEDDFLVLRPETGLPTRAILAGAVGPIVFDSVRNLLITGDATDTSQLTLWNTSDWSGTHSSLAANGRSIANAKLSLDESGSRLVALRDGDLYQQNLATAAAAVATVVGNGITRVQFGMKSIGRNAKPILTSLDPVVVSEDGLLELDAEKIRSRSTDLDGDSIVYLVRSNPMIGQISLNQDATGTYQPFVNATGEDIVTIQAYDGRDWSSEQMLPIVISAVNDLPSGIAISIDAMDENPTVGSALATIRALDPDSDSDYHYHVNDSRFSVDDGILRLLKGTVSFEDEPVIVLVVTGVNRLRLEDTTSSSITINIRDVNDAPTGIGAPSRVSLPELTHDLVLGRVSAIDQDKNDSYTWVLSDSRFEIVNDVLRMTKGSTVDFESEPSIALVVRGKDSRGQFEVEKTITVTVTDQDDEPTGITLSSFGTLQEGATGKSIGEVSVMDPDRGEVYSFSVNDSRFEVVRGVVKLKPGAAVSETVSGFLDLIVTATSLRSGIQASGTLRLNILTDPTPYHNDEDPYDVDGDGRLTPLDPLIIINHINNSGIGPIEEPGEGEGALPDLDVDGDGEVTPLDILILINKLNQQNEDDFNSTEPEPEGEGELAPIVKSPTESVPNLYEISLESYLTELSDDVRTKRFRRR